MTHPTDRNASNLAPRAKQSPKNEKPDDSPTTGADVGTETGGGGWASHMKRDRRAHAAGKTLKEYNKAKAS